jgi:hypothetical protein
MSNSKFERTPTTRTDTLLVSDQRVMDQFTRAMAEALEAAESAVTFAGALSDRDLSLALARLDLLQATAERGLNSIKARMREKPAKPKETSTFLDEFSMMEDISEVSNDDDRNLWEDIDAQQDDDEGLISVAQAAQLLGVAGDEVIQLMNNGSLATVASAGQIMLHQDDVKALKQAGISKPKTSTASAAPSAKPTVKPAASPFADEEGDEDFDQILARLFDAPELQET